MTFEDTTQDRVQIAFCQHYHAAGTHDRNLCLVPGAYCDAIGLLVLRVLELERKVAAAQRAQVVNLTGGRSHMVTPGPGGGGGGGGGRADGGGGGGGGYNLAHRLNDPENPGWH